jgi:prepilin-type N-terminal cleavage/methylation domain-containing protein
VTQRSECGISLIEVSIVVAIIAIVAGMAVPYASNTLNEYRLNSDASDLASCLNVARMKAASQFAPYRININATQSTFNMEELCGGTASSVDANCSGGANPYAEFSSPAIDGGTQYASQGDAYSTCRPSGVTSYPGDITADAQGCPSSLEIWFNTRGAPVSGSGGVLSNGGAVVYLSNTNGMIDAITASLGGRVTIWSWNAVSAQWVTR